MTTRGASPWPPAGPGPSVTDMALDAMLAADIEQQLKTMDKKDRAQFVLDLVGVVHGYVTSDAVGEENVDGSESDGLDRVIEAARRHVDAVSGSAE